MLATYNGVRREDFVNADMSDFTVTDDGRLVMRIDQGKTEASRRRYPVHHAVLDAGFAEDLASRPQGAPLAEVAADADGNRSNNAGATLKQFLTIHRKSEASWHSFRHSWKVIARHFIRRENVSDYLSGNANSSESRKYGTKGKHKGFPLLTLIEAIDKQPSAVEE